MSSLLLLIVCLVGGVLAARLTEPPPELARSLNWWVMNIAFSALVLHLIPELQFEWHLWFLVAATWVCFFGAWGFFTLVGRPLGWSRARVGGLTLVCGLGNTAFVGIPLIGALYGEDGLKLALVADQAGSFVMLAVGGTIIAALSSGARVEPATILRKVVLFPPFASLLIGLVAGLLGGWPRALDDIFARVGATLVPIALFSVGLQLRLSLGHGQLRALLLALSWKLGLAPALVCVLGLIAGIEGLTFVVGVLQSAMGPMVSAAILAEQNELEPALVNTILGIGIPLSFLTVPFINHLLTL